MKNYSIIVARRHGSEIPEIISGPEVPMREQRDSFLALRCIEKHPDFEEAELVERNVHFSKRFNPDPVAASEKQDVEIQQLRAEVEANEKSEAAAAELVTAREEIQQLRAEVEALQNQLNEKPSRKKA